MYGYYEGYDNDCEYDYNSPNTRNNIATDESLVKRIRQTQEHLHFLKQKLAIEKENLQMELVASKQLFENQASMEMSQYNICPHQVYHSAAETNLQQSNYNMPLYNWDTGYQNYQAAHTSGSCLHSQFIPTLADDYLKKLARDSSVYNRLQIYKGQLETVEKECDHELNRMQDSIGSLRNMRKYWEKYQLYGPSTSAPEHSLENTEKRRGHRSHNKSQEKRPSSAKYSSRPSSHQRRQDRSHSRGKDSHFHQR